MTTSRREFLKLGSTAAALTALGPLGCATADTTPAQPVLGMIFPPANYPVPPEATRLYPSGITFLARGVGLTGMTPEGYDEAIPRVIPAAKELAAEGATAISVMGTSLTFYKGAAFNQQIIDEVQQATGLPTTSMSSGIVDGLRAAKASRVAVATAYIDEVTHRLQVFLEESGFEVSFANGLGYLRVPDTLTQETLFDFSAGVFDEAPDSDALLVSCGGLSTIDLVVPLEEHCHTPVVTSTEHALWHSVRFAGFDGRRDGYGRVIAGA